MDSAWLCEPRLIWICYFWNANKAMPLPLSSVRASVVESDGDPLAPNADPAVVDGSAPLDQIRSGNGCNKQGEKEREREWNDRARVTVEVREPDSELPRATLNFVTFFSSSLSLGSCILQFMHQIQESAMALKKKTSLASSRWFPYFTMNTSSAKIKNVID